MANKMLAVTGWQSGSERSHVELEMSVSLSDYILRIRRMGSMVDYLTLHHQVMFGL